MVLLVVGLSHRDVPVDLLERMTVPAARLPKALDDLTGRAFVSESVILSTCHRTEVYAVTESFHGGVQSIRDFLSDLAFVAPEDFSDYLVTYHDEAAVSHLLAVAAGVESVVRGESQILGQVRLAWERAQASGACGGRLDAVFRHAMETGKRVRSETAIGMGMTSLSQAAVAMAADRLGSLDGRRVVVLGAGEMGEGVVADMADRAPGDAAREVVVASRTRARAQLVAERVGARTVDLEDLDRALEDADLLVTSTGAPSAVVTTARMADVVERRGGRPLLIVDMGMPRDVDPGVGRLAGRHPARTWPTSGPTSTQGRTSATRWSGPGPSSPTRPPASSPPPSSARRRPRSAPCGPGPRRCARRSWPATAAGCRASTPASRRRWPPSPAASWPSCSTSRRCSSSRPPAHRGASGWPTRRGSCSPWASPAAARDPT